LLTVLAHFVNEPSPDETLALALRDLWSVVAPLRQARAGD